MAWPSRMWFTPQNAIEVTVGYPDDGRTYGEIGPMTDTLGERVVWFHRGVHHYGFATSDPIPGEHIDTIRRTRGLRGRALYWIYVVRDGDMPKKLRGQTAPEALVPIQNAWLVPVDPVQQQTA